MPTVYRYAESNSKTGFYLKGWLPDHGNTTLQVHPIADELLSWMEFSHGQKLPHEFFTALRKSGLLYTESEAGVSSESDTSFQSQPVRNALTPRQYKRLLGFLEAKTKGNHPNELTAFADHFLDQDLEIPDTAVPTSNRGTTEVEHGRFADIVDDVFGESDDPVDDQATPAGNDWIGVTPTLISETADVRWCRIQTYDPEASQATVKFDDTDETAIVTVASEASSPLTIEQDTAYMAEVEATTDGRRLTRLWRSAETGPAITPVHADIQHCQVDVLVCPTGTRLAMHGGVAGALRRAGDDELETAAMAEAPVSEGEIVVTEAPGLQAEYVLHAVTDSDTKRTQTTAGLVRDLTADVIQFGQDVNARTVAIPLLGCGSAGLDPADGAHVIMQTLVDEGMPNTEYRVVANTSEAYEHISECHSKYVN